MSTHLDALDGLQHYRPRHRTELRLYDTGSDDPADAKRLPQSAISASASTASLNAESPTLASLDAVTTRVVDQYLTQHGLQYTLLSTLRALVLKHTHLPLNPYPFVLDKLKTVETRLSLTAESDRDIAARIRNEVSTVDRVTKLTAVRDTADTRALIQTTNQYAFQTAAIAAAATTSGGGSAPQTAKDKPDLMPPAASMVASTETLYSSTGSVVSLNLYNLHARNRRVMHGGGGGGGDSLGITNALVGMNVYDTIVAREHVLQWCDVEHCYHRKLQLNELLTHDSKIIESVKITRIPALIGRAVFSSRLIPYPGTIQIIHEYVVQGPRFEKALSVFAIRLIEQALAMSSAQSSNYLCFGLACEDEHSPDLAIQLERDTKSDAKITAAASSGAKGKVAAGGKKAGAVTGKKTVGRTARTSQREAGILSGAGAGGVTGMGGGDNKAGANVASAAAGAIRLASLHLEEGLKAGGRRKDRIGKRTISATAGSASEFGGSGAAAAAAEAERERWTADEMKANKKQFQAWIKSAVLAKKRLYFQTLACTDAEPLFAVKEQYLKQLEAKRKAGPAGAAAAAAAPADDKKKKKSKAKAKGGDNKLSVPAAGGGGKQTAKTGAGTRTRRTKSKLPATAEDEASDAEESDDETTASDQPIPQPQTLLMVEIDCQFHFHNTETNKYQSYTYFPQTALLTGVFFSRASAELSSALARRAFPLPPPPPPQAADEKKGVAAAPAAPAEPNEKEKAEIAAAEKEAISLLTDEMRWRAIDSQRYGDDVSLAYYVFMVQLLMACATANAAAAKSESGSSGSGAAAAAAALNASKKDMTEVISDLYRMSQSLAGDFHSFYHHLAICKVAVESSLTTPNSTLLNGVMDVLSTLLPAVVELVRTENNAAYQGMSERIEHFADKISFNPTTRTIPVVQSTVTFMGELLVCCQCISFSIAQEISLMYPKPTRSIAVYAQRFKYDMSGHLPDFNWEQKLVNVKTTERWNTITGAVPIALSKEAVFLQYCIDTEFDTFIYDTAMDLLNGKSDSSARGGYGLPPNPYFVCIANLKRYSLKLDGWKDSDSTILARIRKKLSLPFNAGAGGAGAAGGGPSAASTAAATYGIQMIVTDIRNELEKTDSDVAMDQLALFGSRAALVTVSPETIYPVLKSMDSLLRKQQSDIGGLTYRMEQSVALCGDFSLLGPHLLLGVSEYRLEKSYFVEGIQFSRALELFVTEVMNYLTHVLHTTRHILNGIYIDKKKDNSIDLLQLKLPAVQQRLYEVISNSVLRHQRLTVKLFAFIGGSPGGGAEDDADPEAAAPQRRTGAGATLRSGKPPPTVKGTGKTGPSSPQAKPRTAGSTQFDDGATSRAGTEPPRYALVAIDFVFHFLSTSDQRMQSSVERSAQPYENIFLTLDDAIRWFYFHTLSLRANTSLAAASGAANENKLSGAPDPAAAAVFNQNSESVRRFHEYSTRLQHSIDSSLSRSDYAIAYRSLLKWCLLRDEGWNAPSALVADGARVLTGFGGCCHQLIVDCGTLIALASQPAVIDINHKNRGDPRVLVRQFKAFRYRAYELILYSDSCVVANGLKDVCIELLEEANTWIDLIGTIDLEVKACLIDLQRRLRVFERAALYFAHANATDVRKAFKSFATTA